MEPNRLGLALSGGGFRASFFHLGVLARMADEGLLRHVEVISTVSGGSIVGAFYYVHLKKLLESTASPGDGAYQQLVREVQKDFLEAVQRNIRMETFANPLKNLRMTMDNYSRSDRIGELYDRYLYRPALFPGRTTPVEMRELKITPAGTRTFRPSTENVGRPAKVPILLINSTSLNNGHNWRFEATRMGEPPLDDVAFEIDKNVRLARAPGYEDINRTEQDFPLGLAVAASAGVPGLFNPLAIDGLYPGIRLQLVDGGVHDNQGVNGLVERRCTHFVISDACGQMLDQRMPGTGPVAVPLRSNEILMDRVREESLRSMWDRFGSEVIAFPHLNKGIQPDDAPWYGPNGTDINSPPPRPGPAPVPSSAFGVSEEVQELLARIRTDLDCFTEVEAFALMYDGYRISEFEFSGRPAFLELLGGQAAVTPAQWEFAVIERWMRSPTARFKKHLQVGSQTFLKIFRLRWDITLFVGLALLLPMIALTWWGWEPILRFLDRSVSYRTIVVTGLMLLLSFLPGFKNLLLALKGPRDFLMRFVFRGLLPMLGALPIWLHLKLLNPLFIKEGKVARLVPPS